MIELLVVIAIIGIVAAIAIMNYLNALTRARQKRTMSDIRTIATAWEQRGVDRGSYSTAGFSYPAGPVTGDALEAALAPHYIRTLPKEDGWGRPFEFAFEDQVYAIRSAGRDGTWEGTDYEEIETTNADCDIVFSNGRFIRAPQTGEQN